MIGLTPSTDALPLVRTPWTIGPIALPHRIVMGSMHTGLEARDDGGEALAAFYRERAEAGAAFIITGGLAISSVAKGGPDYGVLGDPAFQARARRAVDAVHESGSRIAAQLFHAGRYALIEEQAVAPSAVPWRAARGAVPRAMSAEEIEGTIADFARAAADAVAAGFDAVEIMASEGYLINQFCSPITNLRDDEWGGDAERRRRFAVEVVRAVRSAVPESVATIVRISGNDLMPGSSSQREVGELAVALAGAGAHALSVGVGWHESAVPTVQSIVPHGAWLRYAELVSEAVKGGSGTPIPVIASNRVTDLRDAERILARGGVDAVAVARPFLADPAIVERSLAGRFDRINGCIGCDQACIDRSLTFARVSCLVNPRAGHEAAFPLALERRRSIAVVGGGPAGLAAAVDLARRGHAVTLFEADDRLGGQFRLAERVPGKEDYATTAASASVELNELGADVRTGTRATVADLAGFDAVILATGVVPRPVTIPGAELPNVLSYEQAIRDGVPDGTVAIIGGGGIGVDLATTLVESHDPEERARSFAAIHGLDEPASLLAESRRDGFRTRPGSDVTVLRRSGKFGAGVGITSRWVVLGGLRRAGVRMVSGLEYRSITADGVEVVHEDGTVELIPGRTVVICAGQLSFDPLSEGLARAGVRFEVVGGARDASSVDAVRATTEGLAAARAVTDYHSRLAI
jgi:2,4-dienoyl-CoA reductase (NADPH2)